MLACATMPFTFNGIGTMYYGARDFALNGTYTTTEWFTVLYVPLIPLHSLRISDTNQSSNFVVYSSRRYYIHAKGKPNLKQVFSIYAWWGALVLSICFAAWMPRLELLVYIPLLILAFLPWILRRRARKRLLTPFQAIYSSFQAAPKSDEYNVLLQARDQGWDSERTQQEMAKVVARNKSNLS